MVRNIYILLLLVTNLCFSQDEHIKILLTNDSVVTTNWIELHDLPYFQSPFIKIHNHDGPKIKIRNIQNYRGYDKFGNYRQLVVFDSNPKRKCYFTERKFQLDSTKKVKIYYNQIVFGFGVRYLKTNNVNYSLCDNDLRKLNYRNLKKDLNDINSSVSLKKANQIRIIQFISVGIGAAILTNVLAENWYPLHSEFLNKQSNFKLIASGLFLTFPFALERTKQKRLLEALRSIK